MQSIYETFGLFLLLFLLLALDGCAESWLATSERPLPSQSAVLQEGQIIEAATGRPISIDRLMDRLFQQDVVYLGEEHHNRFHIEVALSILDRLTAEARRPLLAMEMFGWDDQAVLDRYVEGNDLSRQEFLDQLRWKQNWGGPFEDYEGLVSYAKSHHLSLTALNPPKPLIKLVARHSLSKARLSPEWSRWGMQDEAIVDDPHYRERILSQLHACHDGGSDEMYRTMYEASMVRDEGMARTIVSLVSKVRMASDPAAGPVLSYTGGGHIQYSLPVPKRVARRLDDRVRQISIYMTSYDKSRLDDLHEMIDGKIADYVWLTPVPPQGPPRRCR